MRYIGNKEKIIGEIEKILKLKKLDKKGFVFFDAFSGTGTVSDYFKDRYKIISNDNLYTAFILTTSKLKNINFDFDKIGFNIFDDFNNIENKVKGFIYNNYTLGNSERMYFSEDNAARIDYIRLKIEELKENKKITENQYYYLIACLLESTSKVANIAGVYGSYLKTWDKRALKDMIFLDVEKKQSKIEFKNEIFNCDIENIINDIECDILYLDPPYTKNQYSTQYHLLETIALYDNPKIIGKTGGRYDTKLKNSKFSKNISVNIIFEKLISESKSKYIIISYSSDGLMSKDYIEAVLKRYGKEKTYYFKKFNYRRYKNNKLEYKEHFEYLFFIEKKEKNEIKYISPLNYMGGKYEILEEIKERLPKKINVFYDLFSGGFNVGLNVNSKKVIYNDINFKVKELIEFFYENDSEYIYKEIQKNIKKYKLEKNKKEEYINFRTYYNNSDYKKIVDLYTLILFGFQQQIRFNSKIEFNNPIGQSGLNEKIFEKIVSFSREIKIKNLKFYSKDYEEFLNDIKKDDFVYIDPPYLITLGSYNDGKRGFNGWNENEEKRLLEFLEKLNKKGIRFMLSNVLEHKGKINNLLLKFIEKNNFNIEYLKGKKRKEVLITNYI